MPEENPRGKVQNCRILLILRSLGFFLSYLLCAMGTSLILAGNMGVLALYGAELKTKSDSVTGWNWALVPFGSPRNRFLTHTALFPKI